jgi:hypothetical protein
MWVSKSCFLATAHLSARRLRPGDDAMVLAAGRLLERALADSQ